MGFIARRRDAPSGAFRPEWYDRNPAHRLLSYMGYGVAPHVNTTRWTYTVPTGKKALNEFLHAKVRRATAATTASIPVSCVWDTPAGGSITELMHAAIRTNNVGDKDDVTVGQTITLLVGDALTALTVDGSTGGTCDYVLVAKITEFDA